MMDKDSVTEWRYSCEKLVKKGVGRSKSGNKVRSA